MAVAYQPKGYQTVVPYLVVPDAAAELKFMVEALGATLMEKMEGDGGMIMHAEVKIGDSVVMLGQSSAEHPPRTPMMYVYMPDCDAVYKKALKLGATSVREPGDQFYGDRNAAVTSPGGNEWWISTHIEDLTVDQVMARAAASTKN